MKKTLSVLFPALFSLVCGGATAPPLPAQQLAEGYAATFAPLPPGASCLLHTAGGRVWWNGQDLVLQPDGQPPQVLLHLPGAAFGSFTIQAGPGRVLFAESSQGTLWLVPLAGPAPSTPLATMALPYDAVLLDGNRALVSARTGGFAATVNDLVAVDLTTGQTQLVAQLPGASGPVALAANGDLFYATAAMIFPPPAGSTSVVRLPRPVLEQAILQQTVLGIGAAQLVFAGLDAASALAVDDDGDLLFIDWWNARVGVLDGLAAGTAALAPPLLDYTGGALAAAGLQFLPGALPGVVFEPFQPASGTLLVFETDFFSQAGQRVVSARQPTLVASAASPIPVGPFALHVADGPIQGFGLLAAAPTALGSSLTLQIPGFGQPLHWNDALLAPVVVLFGFDAGGQLSAALGNPGPPGGLPVVFQVAVISASGVLGATPPLELLLGP